MDETSSKVKIIAFSPEPERLCASAAGISTTKGTALELYANNQDPAKAQKLIKNVLRLGHTTTIEHACFTIAFENVSAFVEQFMIEFRLASFTVKSRRYVDFSQMGYYRPEFRFTEAKTEAAKQKIENLYHRHIQKLFSEYEYLAAQGIPREDARFLLPYCYRSNFYCTVNARELHHILYAALEGRGSRYPELKKIGLSLWEQARSIAPAIFETILPESRDDQEERLRAVLGKAGLAPEAARAGADGFGQSSCELLAFTEHPERIVATAALIKHTLCPTAEAVQAVVNNQELLEQVLAVVCENNRKRELEQVSFTFRINNLSLAGLTHLVRHRMQSICVPSFTEFAINKGCILPASIKEQPALLERYRAIWQEHLRVFAAIAADGVVKEDLVYLYLSGNLVDVLTTMNGRELFHFLRLRTCNRAQWEIRAIACEMLRKLRGVSPALFRRFGPSCYVLGKCPEGKLSCGQMETVLERFRSLK
ncbi:MAG TPA: FAD-dependent thymidylate synthase [Peptococcaceae bacterium]|jgi:flavin-dependent thymidylate synthase|nr:FAD-dependent thymidylate synthase [Clostridia bacterium]HOB81358.1 FAD-dependent thymidylate synthase [Peptococcaceae bacterium]HQD54556.1 FAD-dependent thymidylate synthase [Peptococcaceae bacterium]